ncbi:MAG: glycosyltransferase [Phycisphaerales bacterium]
MPPTLSVIIVVYNRREAVLRTIQHVTVALAQVQARRERQAWRAKESDEPGIERVEFEADPDEPDDAGQTGSGPAKTDPPGRVATAAPADESEPPVDILDAVRSGAIIPESVSCTGVVSFSEDDPARSPGVPPDAWNALAEIIVVDNASTDGSAAAVREAFPFCCVIELDANTGVEAFNRGEVAARGKHLLILDDDAWPEPRGLDEGLAELERDDVLGAVMLQPVHPRTGQREWPFDRIVGRMNNWPDLRCANLVRRESWKRVGGYESGFFLYRNDTDLALKLLGAGYDVAYDPSWWAMHDSPHITVRRVRWFVLSTRNWVWMCRRHARRLGWVLPALMGWLWAHRLAGASVARQWAAFRGGVAGFVVPGPRVPACVRRDGKALTRLIELKRRLRNRPHRSMTGP